MASQDDERQSAAPTDLFGSLKIVSNAAQSTFNKQNDQVDYGEVAGAASNLLGAASQYGNLNDQEGLGKYVDQAQDYLQKYHQSSRSDDRPPQDAPADEIEAEPKGEQEAAPFPAPGGDEEGVKPGKTTPAEEEREGKVDAEPERKQEESEEAEGGLGGYAKVGQGFLGKGNEEEGSGGGGAGDYVKLAQGFLGGKSEGGDGGEAGVGDYVNMAKGLFGK